MLNQVDYSKQEKIGSITINIFKGNLSQAVFKGEVPPEVMMSCRVTLQRDYGIHMLKMAALEESKQADRKRVEREAQAEEERKQEELRVAKEKAAFEAEQKLKDAQVNYDTLLKKDLGVDPKPLTVREHEQKVKKAKEVLDNLKK